MRIINPIEIANNEHENSIRITKNITKIINQDRLADNEENEIKEIKKSTAKEREMKQKEQLKSILTVKILLKTKEKDRNVPGTRSLKLANNTPIKRSRFQPE